MVLLCSLVYEQQYSKSCQSYQNWVTGSGSKWRHTKIATNASKSMSTVKYVQYHDKPKSIFRISPSSSDTRTWRILQQWPLLAWFTCLRTV